MPPIKFRPAAKAGDSVSVLLKSHLNMSESKMPFLSCTSAHSNTLGYLFNLYTKNFCGILYVLTCLLCAMFM